MQRISRKQRPEGHRGTGGQPGDGGEEGRVGGPESVLQKQNPTWIQDVLVLVIRRNWRPVSR